MNYIIRVVTAITMLVFIQSGIRGQGTPDSQRIRVESALVTVPVVVSDAQGKFVSGLKSGDFRLQEDGNAVPVSLFLTSEDPLKIALLLDTSRSTTTVLERIKKSASRFLLQMRPQDMAAVISFDSDITNLCPLTSDLRQLNAAIEQAKPGGSGTRMMDAVIDIVQGRFRSISGRKAIIMLTDGQDHGSTISAEKLLDGVEASSTMIYTIFYHVDPRQLMKEVIGVSVRIPKPAGQKEGALDPWQAREEQAAGYLEKISEMSAGRFYRSEVTEFDKAFKQITDELRSQYLLGFYPDQSKLDGGYHALEVRVSIPDVFVRNRRSYRSLVP